MRRVQQISTGAAIAVVVALGSGVVLGRLTSPSSSPPSGVGPRTNANGVPVGYAHSVGGAVAAASNYLDFLGSPAGFDQRKLDAGLRQIAAPGSEQMVDSTKATFFGAQQQLAQMTAGQTGPLLIENKELGYRLAGYDEHHARVVIWGLSIGGNAGNLPPEAGFHDYSLDLQWSRGDWRLVSYVDANGPAPQTQQPPSPQGGFVDEVKTYRAFRNSP